MSRSILRTGIVAAICGLVLVIGCSETESTPTETVIATATSIPTSTPTVVEQFATPTATITPEPTATPEPIEPTATVSAPTVTPESQPPTTTSTDPTSTPEPTATPITPTPTVTPEPPTPIPPTSTPVPTPQITATPNAIGPKFVTPAPVSGQRGGEIKVAVPQSPPHQDIHKSVSPILAAWGPGIAYSRVFRYRWNSPGEAHSGTDALSGRYDPNTSTSAYEIICDLCESWEFADDTTLSIKLRPNVAWQDTNPGLGRDLTATDVAFSINRLTDPTFANSPLVNTVAEVRAVSDDTVEIELTLPDAEIFDKLADARMAIVSPEAVNLNGDLIEGPTIGTGPWIQTVFETGAMRFEANQDYFVPELPLLDGIIVAIIEDAASRTTSLRTGQMDLIQPALNDLVDAVERFPELRWTRSHDASAGIEVAFNTRRGYLVHHFLRNAILYSWDPNALIDTLHDGQSFISSGLPLNDPHWLLPSEEIDSRFNDRKMVLELMEGISIPRGIDFTIRVGQFGDDYIDTANSLASAVQSLGITVAVEPVSTRQFGEEVWLDRDYDIYVGAPPPQSSVTSMLFAIHHSGSLRNTTGYSSPELDALIERQATENNPATRRELLLEIQREIFRGAHLFRAAANVYHWSWWSHLNNVVPNTFRADSFWLARMWLGDRVRG